MQTEAFYKGVVALQKTLSPTFENYSKLLRIDTLKYTSLINPVIMAVSKISAPISNISALSESLIKTFEPFQRTMNSLSNSFASSVGRQTVLFSEAFERYRENEKRFIIIASKAGWAPPMTIPISFYRRCVKYYLNYGEECFKEYIDKEIIDFYDENEIAGLLKHWASSKLISNRSNILSDAIKAHNEELYNTSIPTLITQIEGLIFQCNAHVGWMNKDKIQRYIDIILSGNDNYSPIKGLIIDELYQNFIWGDDTIKDLSRHAILHGADTKYGTKINSLRMIVLFDFLLYLYEFHNR